MEGNMKQFLQLADEDKELGNTLKSLIRENEPDLIEKVIALADTKGIVLVREDFVSNDELSLDELAGVAGGSYIDELDCFITHAYEDTYGGWWHEQR